MRFGLQINPYVAGETGNPWDSVLRIAKLADASALDSLWVYDHFLYEGGFPGHPFTEPVMECFTTLGAIAAVTSRVRLGQMVVGTPYRNPAMLAKMATTLDLISQGRSILGIGAGWHKREYEGYGWGTFEEVPTRLKRLDEALQVIMKLWTERPANFAGAFYNLQEVMDNPAPLQKPHPPILIGGNGEKVTLRLVAQYGQLCNVQGNPEEVERLFGLLSEHCERLHRPYNEITRSIYVTLLVGQDEAAVAAKKERLGDFIPGRGSFVGTPAQVVSSLGEFARRGCQYVIFRTPDWFDPETLQLISREGHIPFG